jgi:hypothetical protein
LAGYSGAPLGKKLGIRPGTRIWVVDAPSEYRSWLQPLPENVTFRSGFGRADCNLVHLFVASLSELDRKLPLARERIIPHGAIWVSWHKKSSKVPSDVTEDAIRARALRTDLVDVKVCAVTEIWSGLKLVVRKQLR